MGHHPPSPGPPDQVGQGHRVPAPRDGQDQGVPGGKPLQALSKGGLQGKQAQYPFSPFPSPRRLGEARLGTFYRGPHAGPSQHGVVSRLQQPRAGSGSLPFPARPRGAPPPHPAWVQSTIDWGRADPLSGKRALRGGAPPGGQGAPQRGGDSPSQGQPGPLPLRRFPEEALLRWHPQDPGVPGRSGGDPDRGGSRLRGLRPGAPARRGKTPGVPGASWWARVDLNHRPLPCQGSALAT